MKPTPIGRIPSGAFGRGEVWKDSVASEIKDDNVPTSVPAPRNPRPPARVTAFARGQVDIRRIGAETIKGERAHGYWALRISV